ncbi:MAG: LamG-like jellyroll fold domain-containing protein [Planctomycetota bacterium]|jgi:hypothetical protein
MLGELKKNLVACILVCVVISLGFVNGASADVFSDANLVGYWQFSGDANDSSYCLNDGTLNGDAYASYDILELDGTGDYVQVSDDSTLDITGDITISAWIRLGKGSAYQGIVTKAWWAGSVNTPYDFRTLNTTIPQLALVRSDASGHESVYSTQGCSLNEWHHVAVRVDNKDVDFFVDGLVTGKTGTLTKTPTANSRPLYIGRRDDGLYLDGKIDDVMVYDAALNSWEISQLYDEGNKGYVYSNNIVGDIFRGGNCTATGEKSVALGNGTTASGDYSTAMGYSTEASGDYSIAGGRDANALGNGSVAFGRQTQASGDYSFAAGYGTNATADEFGLGMSTAIGVETTASGYISTAMGLQTTASAYISTAMGQRTTASGNVSTAIGNTTTASGFSSTAMGCGSEAAEDYSIAAGYDVQATEDYSIAFGKYSINDVADSFTVGYGSGEGSEQVDFRVRSGQVNVYGDLDVTDTVTMGTLVLPVKTTTGDPASPVEGQIYVNTYDNRVSVYADGAWRDLATW